MEIQITSRLKLVCRIIIIIIVNSIHAESVLDQLTEISVNTTIDIHMPPIFQGQALGPLELQISTLQKQIEATNNEIMELQQFWLRNQSELVKTVQRVGQQSGEIKSLKKQYTILLQKKLRTEGLLDVLLFSEIKRQYTNVEASQMFDYRIALFTEISIKYCLLYRIIKYKFTLSDTDRI